MRLVITQLLYVLAFGPNQTSHRLHVVQVHYPARVQIYFTYANQPLSQYFDPSLSNNQTLDRWDSTRYIPKYSASSYRPKGTDSIIARPVDYQQQSGPNRRMPASHSNRYGLDSSDDMDVDMEIETSDNDIDHDDKEDDDVDNGSLPPAQVESWPAPAPLWDSQSSSVHDGHAPATEKDEDEPIQSNVPSSATRLWPHRGLPLPPPPSDRQLYPRNQLDMEYSSSLNDFMPSFDTEYGNYNQRFTLPPFQDHFNPSFHSESYTPLPWRSSEPFVSTPSDTGAVAFDSGLYPQEDHAGAASQYQSPGLSSMHSSFRANVDEPDFEGARRSQTRTPPGAPRHHRFRDFLSRSDPPSAAGGVDAQGLPQLSGGSIVSEGSYLPMRARSGTPDVARSARIESCDEARKSIPLDEPSSSSEDDEEEDDEDEAGYDQSDLEDGENSPEEKEADSDPDEIQVLPKPIHFIDLRTPSPPPVSAGIDGKESSSLDSMPTIERNDVSGSPVIVAFGSQSHGESSRVGIVNQYGLLSPVDMGKGKEREVITVEDDSVYGDSYEESSSEEDGDSDAARSSADESIESDEGKEDDGVDVDSIFYQPPGGQPAEIFPVSSSPLIASTQTEPTSPIIASPEPSSQPPLQAGRRRNIIRSDDDDDDAEAEVPPKIVSRKRKHQADDAEAESAHPRPSRILQEAVARAPFELRRSSGRDDGG